MQLFRQFYLFRQINTIALFITYIFNKQKEYADVFKHALCVSWLSLIKWKIYPLAHNVRFCVCLCMCVWCSGCHLDFGIRKIIDSVKFFFESNQCTFFGAIWFLVFISTVLLHDDFSFIIMHQSQNALFAFLWRMPMRSSYFVIGCLSLCDPPCVIFAHSSTTAADSVF